MRPEIPGCTIIAEVHRSPVAVIYRARQNALDRTVLVKVLQTNLPKDSDIARRFQREAKACARLKHANIVQIYDYGESAAVPYFIMEYVEGRNLQEIIREEKQLDVGRGESITRQLLQALKYSHEKGVLHRDIKPANILVGQDDFVKITDFGLAVLQQSPEITEHDQIVGTPAYMSPEQARGEKVDARSDLFSLGVTIFEMLTGEQLFGGETITESLHKLLQRPVDFDKLQRTNLPGRFFELCQKLLQKDVDKRCPSAHEALKILQGSGLPETVRTVPAQTGRKSLIRSVIPFFVLAGLTIAIGYYIYWKNFSADHSGNMIQKESQITTVPVSDDSTQNNPDERLEIQTPGKRSDPVNRQIDNPKELQRAMAAKRVRTRDSVKSSIVPERNQPVQAGFVRIQCLPWADVWIDSQAFGEADFKNLIRLEAGEHLLKLENPHFGEYLDTIQVAGGDTQKIAINLNEQFGQLQLRVHPWAKVYIDDNYVDDSPIWESIRLKRGLHRVRLENPSFKPWEQEIFIKAGEKKELVITLK